MRKFIWMAAAKRFGGRAKPNRLFIGAASVAIVALVGAGIAVAHESQGKSVKAVSATFTAATGGNVRTDTCTGGDGTYATTRGTWTGTATSSDASLNGPVTIDARSLVNTTTGYGTVSGHLRIDTSDGKHTVGAFDAVYTNGHIAGLAEGRGSEHWNGLVANLSSDWSSAGGFANGKLGGGTTGGDAVELTSGGCKAPEQAKPETVEANGAITAVSATSITVAGVTCTVPSTLATLVNGLTVGNRVGIKCTSSTGTNTLTKLEGNRDSHHDSGKHDGKDHH